MMPEIFARLESEMAPARWHSTFTFTSASCLPSFYTYSNTLPASH